MVYGFSFSARALFGDNRSFAFFGAAASVAALFDFWRQAVEKIGIIKEIDALGRLCIPKEIRTKLGINEYDTLTIEIQDDTIILKKSDSIDYQARCEKVIDLIESKKCSSIDEVLRELKGEEKE
jgi:AbrB family looped-hinge helix DNA binding protein